MARILVVDDSVSIRSMVVATLQSGGHEVADAGDGQLGLDVAKSDRFDAVITDFNMPVMNGIELVENLRQLKNYRYTPILLLTTESAPEKRAMGKRAGATGWLVKPFNPDELLSTLDRVLN